METPLSLAVYHSFSKHPWVDLFENTVQNFSGSRWWSTPLRTQSNIVVKNQLKFFYSNYSNFNKTKFIDDFERSNFYPPQPKKDVYSEYNNLLAKIQKC